MRIGSLFAGIGGIDLAFQNAGFDIAWQVEKDEFCQQVLAKNFPDVDRYGDIFDCKNLPHVDVITAGFPCQPFSVAGKRQGRDDDRFLIPEMLRVIREVKPYVLFLENVPGFASLTDGLEFRRLLGALAEMGYDAQWGHLRASDVGAPHQRERWFCVGYKELPDAESSRCIGRERYKHPQRILSDQDGSDKKDNTKWGRWSSESGGGSETVPDTESQRRQSWYSQHRSSWGNRARRVVSKGEQRRPLRYELRQLREIRIPPKQPKVVNPTGARFPIGFKVRQRTDETEDRGRMDAKPERPSAVGNAPRIDLQGCKGTREQEPQAHERPQVYRSAGSGEKQEPSFKSRLDRDFNGLPARLDRHQFPAPRNVPQYAWEPARTTDRTDGRRDRIKALGNAVVPQVVYPIALSIYEFLIGG